MRLARQPYPATEQFLAEGVNVEGYLPNDYFKKVVLK